MTMVIINTNLKKEKKKRKKKKKKKKEVKLVQALKTQLPLCSGAYPAAASCPLRIDKDVLRRLAATGQRAGRDSLLGFTVSPPETVEPRRSPAIFVSVGGALLLC